MPHANLIRRELFGRASQQAHAAPTHAASPPAPAHGLLLRRGGLAWFVSPLPEVLANSIVDGIPLDEDIVLGTRGVQSANYRLQPTCRPGRRCVDDIGRDIISALSSRHPEMRVDNFDWRFAVTSDTFANAFAYPGGRIFVTRGLLDMATDDEVAAVLGHEVGHVLHRHSQKRLVQQRLGSILIRTLLSSDVDGDGRSEGFGREVGGLLLGYADQLGSMSYSRSNEYEADHVGWYASVTTPWVSRKDGLQTFFRKLDGGDRGTAWHSTHPGSRERIATLDKMGRELAALERRSPRRTASGAVSTRGGSSDAAAQLAPPIKYAGGGSSGSQGGGGVVSSVASAAGTVWTLMPRELQQLALTELVWGAAHLLEAAWDAVVASDDPPEAAAETGRQQQQQQQRRRRRS